MKSPNPSKKYPRIPPQLLDHCRELRKNAPSPESLLWQLLRARRLLGYKFRRQHPVGRYILDFYCREKRLAIELDGGGHLDSIQAARDQDRTDELSRLGIRVIRFWNHEVLQDTETVLEVIVDELLAHAS